ncbi:MAG: hypothetical protein ACP5TK_00645 [Candidatus Micrarchaeia archaeon]
METQKRKAFVSVHFADEDADNFVLCGNSSKMHFPDLEQIRSKANYIIEKSTYGTFNFEKFAKTIGTDSVQAPFGRVIADVSLQAVNEEDTANVLYVIAAQRFFGKILKIEGKDIDEACATIDRFIKNISSSPVDTSEEKYRQMQILNYTLHAKTSAIFGRHKNEVIDFIVRTKDWDSIRRILSIGSESVALELFNFAMRKKEDDSKPIGRRKMDEIIKLLSAGSVFEKLYGYFEFDETLKQFNDKTLRETLEYMNSKIATVFESQKNLQQMLIAGSKNASVTLRYEEVIDVGGAAYKVLLDPNDIMLQLKGLNEVSSCFTLDKGANYLDKFNKYAVYFLQNPNTFFGVIVGEHETLMGRFTVGYGSGIDGKNVIMRLSRIYMGGKPYPAKTLDDQRFEDKVGIRVDEVLKRYANEIGAVFRKEGYIKIEDLELAYDDYIEKKKGPFFKIKRE